MEAEELTHDQVCRTCLCSREDSLESQEELGGVDFFEMLNKTFGRIVHPSQDMPQKICLECQEIIRAAHEFKLKVQRNTKLLLGIEYSGSQLEDKDTQTDQSQPFQTRKHRLSINFDDENFDSMNLQRADSMSEDSIFEGQPNPLLESTEPAVEVKTEELAADVDFAEEGEIIEADDEDASGMVLIKTEDNEDLVCDVNPFNGDESENNKIHRCEHCNKCFSRATHLKRHKLTHEEGRIQCSICDKKFTRLDHLNLHVASNHSETKPFQCEVPDCRKGFVRQEHLKKHMEAKHSDGTKDKEICDICSKTFASKKYLRVHMKSHSSEFGKGLVCKYCNMVFSEKTELNDHMAADHQNEKPYLCSECGLRFVRNDYLVIHMRRHMGVKPYKCRFCDKGFPRATDLTVHERYHTNEKTHLCNLCGKGFQRAYNLLVHMRVHTGEKPYHCSFCNKSFSQGNDLKAHIRRHTGERFKCDLCNEGFIQGYHLTHHKRTVHGLDVKSHIRRVEKFVSSSSGNPSEEDKQIEILEAEQVKMESDYQYSTISTTIQN